MSRPRSIRFRQSLFLRVLMLVVAVGSAALAAAPWVAGSFIGFRWWVYLVGIPCSALFVFAAASRGYSFVEPDHLAVDLQGLTYRKAGFEHRLRWADVDAVWVDGDTLKIAFIAGASVDIDAYGDRRKPPKLERGEGGAATLVFCRLSDFRGASRANVEAALSAYAGPAIGAGGHVSPPGDTEDFRTGAPVPPTGAAQPGLHRTPPPLPSRDAYPGQEDHPAPPPDDTEDFGTGAPVPPTGAAPRGSPGSHPPGGRPPRPPGDAALSEPAPPPQAPGPTGSRGWPRRWLRREQRPTPDGMARPADRSVGAQTRPRASAAAGAGKRQAGDPGRTSRPDPPPGRDGGTDRRTPVRVDIRARMDARVGVGEVAPVTVLLSRQPLPAWAGPVAGCGQGEAAPGVPIAVEVVPRANLAVVGTAVRQLPVPDPDYSGAVVFLVRATHPGRGELWVVVRQESMPLLQPLVLAPLVLAPDVTPERGDPDLTQVSSGARFPARTAPSGTAPLHVLRIHEERHGGSTVYRYDLEAHNLRLLAAFASRPILGDRDAYVRALYRRIENCWTTSLRDVETFVEQLRAFGAELLDELVPPELQALLWANRRVLRDILVLSTEPFIPWELLHLKDPAVRRLPGETCFLGQLGVVRWLWGPYPPQKLPLRPGRARHVIPDYPGPLCLPEAAAERAFVERVAGATPVRPHHREVLATLRSDDFDLLHFAGHGRASTSDIADAQLLLEGRSDHGVYVEELLRVSVVRHNFFRTGSVHGPAGGHPVVVMNACQAGRLGHGLSTIGGFAEAFVLGGAGVFVGCLWSVGDVPARAFVEEFYRCLLDGRTVAEATVAGREKARSTGDATWLAYTVYAHPRARLAVDAAD